jgi:Tol biopolymer transport system component
MMRTRSFGLLLAAGLWVSSLLPTTFDASAPVQAQAVAGRIVAPANRQLAVLDLLAPRPRLLTSFEQPAYVTDVGVSPGGGLAVVAVARPFGEGGAIGGDLVRVDLASSQTATLMSRSDASESLAAPVWTVDARAVVFERQDRAGPGIGFPGAASVAFPTRIETVAPDGSGRAVLVDDGRQPAPAPDGSGIAFLRTSEQGTALLFRSLSDASDRVLVDFGPFRDLASPRYSPDGDRLAFMAPGVFNGHVPFGYALLAPGVAWAHGLPWDLWVIRADGSDLHLLAQVGADDGTLAWSPDGSQLFIYGGTGSFVVDADSGDATPLTYVSGYGTIAWLPG